MTSNSGNVFFHLTLLVLMKLPNWDEQDSILLKVIHQGGQIGSKYLNGDLPS